MVGPEALSSRGNQSLGKVPPHSLEAEEALLGSALLSREAVTRLMEEVKPTDFYSPSNQSVFEAMKGLFLHNAEAQLKEVDHDLTMLRASIFSEEYVEKETIKSVNPDGTLGPPH